MLVCEFGWSDCLNLCWCLCVCLYLCVLHEHVCPSWQFGFVFCVHLGSIKKILSIGSI